MNRLFSISQLIYNLTKEVLQVLRSCPYYSRPRESILFLSAPQLLFEFNFQYSKFEFRTAYANDLFRPEQKDQINFILSREKYFEIDARVRTTFRNGICLFACWGVMALYAIGSSLYIFSAFLVCSPNLKPKKMR